MQFDVTRLNAKSIELLPDFFKPQLDENQREIYENMLENMTVDNGAIQVTGDECQVFDPPERVSLSEIRARYKDEWGFDLKEDEWV